MEMMKAAVVYGKNDLRVEDYPVPDVPKGSIRVRVEACAICGTDKRIYTKGDYRAQYPVIIGHEIAGVIEAVDEGVKGWLVGKRVCVAPGHGCGQCRMCTSGFPNICQNPFPSLGYKVNGGFARYLAVPENILRLGFVNRIPENLSFEQASLSEIIACCLNAQNNVSVHKGDCVLIMGCGPAGIIHAHLAREAGAEKIIVTQRSGYRLHLAKELFPEAIDRIIVSSEEDLEDIVRQETAGLGPDVVIVSAPSREAQEQAIRMVGHHGRVNFFGGLPSDDCMVSFNANDLHYKEFSITGASSSRPEDSQKALQLLSLRVIDPDKLITHRYPIEEIKKGFAAMEEQRCIKAVIKL